MSPGIDSARLGIDSWAPLKVYKFGERWKARKKNTGSKEKDESVQSEKKDKRRWWRKIAEQKIGGREREEEEREMRGGRGD